MKFPILLLTGGLIAGLHAQPAEDQLRSLRKEHPRLIWTREDIAQVKRTIQSDPLAKKWHGALTAEAGKFIAMPGGEEATLYGLAGLGDLLATAYSLDSHNRKVGILLGEGKDLQAIGEAMGSLPEGVKASHTALKIAHSAGISLPLAGWVAKLIMGSPLIRGELFLAIDQTGKL